MIPGQVEQLLGGAYASCVGACDGAGAPQVHRASAVRSEGGGVVTVLVAEHSLGGLADTASGAALAIVVTSPSYESYQLKGVVEGVAPYEARERELLEKRAAVETAARGGSPQVAEVVRRLMPPVGRALRVKVTEVFRQTPGPGAGERILPAGPSPEREPWRAGERLTKSAAPRASLPEAFRPVTENGLPCIVASASRGGVPNVSAISKVYWIDPRRVALSFQFFNKTIRNVREQPRVAVQVPDFFGGLLWNLALEFDHSETEGAIFDQMDLEIETIAARTGTTGIFKLRAADVYDVLGVATVDLKRA